MRLFFKLITYHIYFKYPNARLFYFFSVLLPGRDSWWTHWNKANEREHTSDRTNPDAISRSLDAIDAPLSGRARAHPPNMGPNQECGKTRFPESRCSPSLHGMPPEPPRITTSRHFFPPSLRSGLFGFGSLLAEKKRKPDAIRNQFESRSHRLSNALRVRLENWKNNRKNEKSRKVI